MRNQRGRRNIKEDLLLLLESAFLRTAGSHLTPPAAVTQRLSDLHNTFAFVTTEGSYSDLLLWGYFTLILEMFYYHWEINDFLFLFFYW